jgi:hypothetical protein
MPRISDPAKIDHEDLRELAFFAEWVANLEEASGLLENVFVNISSPGVGEEDPPSSPYEEFDSIELALARISTTFEEMDQELEGRVREWLSRDPEHWPIIRLVILDPWRTKSGWRTDTPDWVRALSTNTAAAHFQQDPFGRKRMIDWDDAG